MKSVPFVALALSLMATSALAQPRHWRDEGQVQAQPPRAEQPRPRPERPQPQAQPQAQPQPRAEARAQFQRGEGRGMREAQPGQQAAQPPSRPDFGERRGFAGGRRDGGPQIVQPQPTPQPQAQAVDERRQFPGRRGDVVNAPQPPQGQWQGRTDRRQFQGDPRQPDARQGDGRWQGRDRSQAQPQQQAPNTGQWDGRRGDGRDASRDGRPGGRDWNRDGRSGADRNAWTRDPNGWNRDGGRGGWDRDHHGPQVRPDWATRNGRYDRDRNRPRYDAYRYPHFFSFQRHFRAPYYAAPFGFYDYDWSYGDYLPWGWYGPSYWIEDWFDYGLPPPPIGCEWVRVGRDAILIDTFDGRVLSVARLLFW